MHKEKQGMEIIIICQYVQQNYLDLSSQGPFYEVVLLCTIEQSPPTLAGFAKEALGYLPVERSVLQI